MIFSRFEFILIFLPVVLLVSYSLPRSWVALWLTMASLFFYIWTETLSWTNGLYGLPLLFFVGFNYLISDRMAVSENPGRRKILAGTGIFFATGWWVVFKIQLLARIDPFMESMVSIGLGFYVLRAIGYYLDLYHRRMPPASSFLNYFLYLAFFAHLPSGPITSWKWFSTHLNRHLETRGIPQWKAGFYLFSIGMLKKAIADTIGSQIDPIIDAADGSSFTASWVTLFAYAIQIYCDFAGYTDMALGIGKMSGIELPPNFDRPYLKRNPIEFWNAWHITLSHWLRDYVFTPAGRSLFSIRSLRRSPLVIATISYLVTFAICGIWHGLERTFLVWGLYHGVGLSCCKAYGEIARRYFPRGYHVFMFNTWMGYAAATGATFVFVSVGWVFFRSHTLSHSLIWLKSLAGYNSAANSQISSDLMIGLSGLVIITALIGRLDWHVEKLAYWQKVVLTANFMVVLFYYFISEHVGMTPFIYNVF